MWPGTQETPAAAAKFLEAILSPMASIAPRVGADEDDPRAAQARGEVGVLRQEAEARVHRLGAGGVAGGEDLVAPPGRTARAGGGPMTTASSAISTARLSASASE